MKDFPPVVQIELTNLCNAKCTMCPVSTMKRKRGIINMNLFKKIINDCSKNDFDGTLYPFLEGESLLIPNILDYLRYTRKKLPKATNHLYTNASKLNNNLGLTILKEELLDILTVSFDGGTKEIYESIRKGLSFENVTKNVHNFIKNRNMLGKKKPKVVIAMIVTKENLNTKKDLEKEFVDADEMGFHKMFNWGGQLVAKKHSSKNKIKKFLTKQNFCNRLMDCFTILINGDVALCCFDYEGKEIIGNVKNSSIKEVWFGETLRKKRESLKNRRFEELPLCSNCDFINNNILIRQIVKLEPKIKKFPWLYKRMKKFYISMSLE